MNSEQKWPDWVKTEEDKVYCDVMCRHDSANIAIMYLNHYFADPAERKKLITGENIGPYIRYVQDLHQKTQKIMDLIAESEYAALLHND